MFVGDEMNILAEFNGWCSDTNVQNAFHLVKSVLEALRLIVPIGLIVMTTFDIVKKTINPDEKDGQKKIMNRILAGIIVFFLPAFISIVFKLIDYGRGYGDAYGEAKAGLSACWR